MPYRIILISSDRARTSHILTLADPKVGDELDIPHWGSVVIHHVTKSNREGLAGVIVAGTA